MSCSDQSCLCSGGHRLYLLGNGEERNSSVIVYMKTVQEIIILPQWIGLLHGRDSIVLLSKKVQ